MRQRIHFRIDSYVRQQAIKLSSLGFDTSRPPLETDPRAIKMAKKPYHDVSFEGNVESDFLYATLLSTDLVPFGHLDYRLVVLPIKPVDDHYVLIDREKANKDGLYGLEKWLDKAEREWRERRGGKAEQMSVYGRLDRVHGLTHQNPKARYYVIYPDVNRIMLASIVVLQDQVSFDFEDQNIEFKSFLGDYTTYFCETNSKDEAMFLVSILNSQVVDRFLEPFRQKGQKAHPHVVKKVFDVAYIPQFKVNNPVHCHLAELGEECTLKVKKWLEGGGVDKTKSIGTLRGIVRKMLSDELEEIDKLVREILE